jgi:hypothetical protein
MNDDNACPVRYTLTPVQAGEYIGEANQHWAEPDIEHAASYMQRLTVDAAYRRQVSEAARQTMAQSFSFAQYARALRTRLEAIQDARPHKKP